MPNDVSTTVAVTWRLLLLDDSESSSLREVRILQLCQLFFSLPILMTRLGLKIKVFPNLCVLPLTWLW